MFPHSREGFNINFTFTGEITILVLSIAHEYLHILYPAYNSLLWGVSTVLHKNNVDDVDYTFHF